MYIPARLMRRQEKAWQRQETQHPRSFRLRKEPQIAKLKGENGFTTATKLVAGMAQL